MVSWEFRVIRDFLSTRLSSFDCHNNKIVEYKSSYAHAALSKYYWFWSSSIPADDIIREQKNTLTLAPKQSISVILFVGRFHGNQWPSAHGDSYDELQHDATVKL